MSRILIQLVNTIKHPILIETRWIINSINEVWDTHVNSDLTRCIWVFEMTSPSLNQLLQGVKKLISFLDTAKVTEPSTTPLLCLVAQAILGMLFLFVLPLRKGQELHSCLGNVQLLHALPLPEWYFLLDWLGLRHVRKNIPVLVSPFHCSILN